MCVCVCVCLYINNQTSGLFSCAKKFLLFKVD